MTRALVIRMGDAELSGAIADGIARPVYGERAIIRGEFAKWRETAERMERPHKGVRTARRVIAENYAIKRHGPVYRAFLGAWGLIWYGMDKLTAWCRT